MVQDIILKASSRSACQEISKPLWSPKVYYHVHKNPPLVRILCWMHPGEN